ncbi:hypothetical protein [Candidatus Methanomassiliicoccus intestinalis]|uniref:hypothetical protein n=1 Tax=Candidatus Methanomassiliicoccus intestinalis TaxID=1406512 RepID=UPI0037DDE2B4
MKTVILCPRQLVDSHALKILTEATHGSIHKTIGRKTLKSYDQYKSAFIVYQYPLDHLNEDFLSFCKLNKELTKRAVLVINLPTPYVEELGAEHFSELVSQLRRSLQAEDFFDFESETTMIFNTLVDKQLQNECAGCLGIALAPSLTRQVWKNSHCLLIFSPVSELFEHMSSFKANLSITAGLIAVPLGALTFYAGVVIYNVPTAFGTACAMIGGGPLLAYIGLRSRKYPRWLKTSVNNQN